MRTPQGQPLNNGWVKRQLLPHSGARWGTGACGHHTCHLRAERHQHCSAGTPESSAPAAGLAQDCPEGSNGCLGKPVRAVRPSTG